MAKTPDSSGRLGIAIPEAVEVAAQRDDTNYGLGSVLNHVMLYKTVIGREALLQMKMDTLGHGFIPEAIYAGGWRYHGMSPFISHLQNLGQIEARACARNTCFAASVQFARARR